MNKYGSNVVEKALDVAPPDCFDALCKSLFAGSAPDSDDACPPVM